MYSNDVINKTLISATFSQKGRLSLHDKQGELCEP
jgi:hypothetical protein